MCEREKGERGREIIERRDRRWEEIIERWDYGEIQGRDLNREERMGEDVHVEPL